MDEPMRTHRLVSPTAAAIAMSLFVLSAPLRAQADCSNAYEYAQRLRMSGKLREAKERAVQCAAESCPQWMQKECAGWIEELTRITPTIVLRVQGADGCDTERYAVTIDDKAA